MFKEIKNVNEIPSVRFVLITLITWGIYPITRKIDPKMPITKIITGNELII
ncbi:hypothetical protein UUR10_0045 [Ureaplasma urealyticum serovar 10 str. ATCC 33699]|jgi:hypothetical protein|uniref:Uncharacterized protein n=1 Tax=Ureaplasma urealyticum serovar 10 (strain ATCC 33699 / Western) TaxID=565575 RepID=B5ZAL8_UREU1|nr:hypothetical protein UUR10_0045 [Ureaplasma urealyticum serovar 10 str. ATCC 33699]